ncbi:MAG: SufE family protein [Chloroflexaceae bacterium]|nr:SufE family protein [Chloroflexaceae bacterium]
MTMTDTVPPRLQALIGAMHDLDGREKLESLLDHADELPPLPDGIATRHDDMLQIHECITPVFVHAELQNGRMQFYFDAPPEGPTMRGYASILLKGLNGETPETILAVPNDIYYQMGLHRVLSPQRLNGVAAVLAYMKRLATRFLAAS